ncbi:unnamed protein product [Schistocephalus solidus]|uniref:Thiamine diphosphokinase n=1 Tax=Schistocephalus solidus TaxID=70667 RepID=A0A183SXC1_SCHSO|nr:unnamed protein product [Schistocephalus solidus]
MDPMLTTESAHAYVKLFYKHITQLGPRYKPLRHIKRRTTNPSVKVINTPDQDATDFTKCLQIVSRAITSMSTSDTVQKISCIVVLYGSGGRADHELGILKTLFIARDLTELPVLLVTESSISWLLIKGSNIVMLESQHIGAYCGLIPIGHSSNVTTTGLEWNLDNQILDFEGLVSTSNKVKDTKITIICDHPILFTIENLMNISP